MLHILLMILKIIGIVLLAILGLLVLLLCVVLLVPVRYQVNASFHGDLKKSKIEIRISWLLHLLSGRIHYLDEKLDYKFRILWKTFSEDSSKAPKEPKKSETELEEEDLHTEEEIEPDEVVTHTLEPEEDAEFEELEEDSDEGDKHTKKVKEDKLEKLKCTIKSVCDKIKMVIEFLKNEAHQATLLRIKKELIRLLVFLKPKKLRGKVHLGMDDPYKTGQILAVLSVFYPFYGENIEIYPDFEQKILKGELHIKGHVRGVYALIIVINLLLDKNVRTTMKDIKALL